MVVVDLRKQLKDEEKRHSDEVLALNKDKVVSITT